MCSEFPEIISGEYGQNMNSQNKQWEFLQNLNNCPIDKSEIYTLIVGGDVGWLELHPIKDI